MFKYDYGKRLKSMVNREIALERREMSLCKQSSKYHDKLEKLELCYAEQKKNFYQIRKRIQEQNLYYDQLERSIQDVRTRILEIENEAQKRLAETVENRQQFIKHMDEIHTLKSATNTFINLHALPERIQGVWVQNTDNGNSWHPFCIEPLSHTPEELQTIIWGNSENAAAYSEVWERLVFCPVREKLINISKLS